MGFANSSCVSRFFTLRFPLPTSLIENHSKQLSGPIQDKDAGGRLVGPAVRTEQRLFLRTTFSYLSSHMLRQGIFYTQKVS